MSPHPRYIYKIVPNALWAEARAQGRFEGAPVDLKDGYIHFSTAAQVKETARRHFAGEMDLLLVRVAADTLGPALKWEPSRGGDLFPHLYAPLNPAGIEQVDPLPLDLQGRHIFPDLPPDGTGQVD